MTKKTIEIVNELKRYFGATVIGSQLFVDAGLLSEEDTNDIDIAVVLNDNTTSRMFEFLKDKGFASEDITTRKDMYSEAILKRTLFYNMNYDKKIDANYFNQMPKVYSITELISEKFNANRADDLKQLSMVIFNKAGNATKSYADLQKFYNENKPDEHETTT